MPEPYDTTLFTNITSLRDVMVNANTMVGGLFGSLALLSLWSIIFLALLPYGSKDAFTASSFITALCAIMLFVGGVVSQSVLIMAVVPIAVGVAWVMLDSQS